MSTATKLREQARRAKLIADDLAERAAAAARAEVEASRPKMPEVTVGYSPVVAFSKYQSGREYQYAAIGWRMGGTGAVRWAVTGSETRRFNWLGLLNFIGPANWNSLTVMVESDTLLPPGAEPAVAETMGRYGAVVSSEVLAESSFVQGGFASGGIVPPLVKAEVHDDGSTGVPEGGGYR